MEYYKGWKITKFRHAGSDWFSAYRWGVSVNTNNINDLISMIDFKIEDCKTPHWRQK